MAKLVDIGGTTYSMPDDATDDDIRKFAERRYQDSELV